MRRTQLRATPLGSLDDLLFERMRFSARCYLHLHCLSFSTVTRLSSSWPGLPRAHESCVVKPPLLKFTMVTSHISHAQARNKPRSMMVRLREVRTEIRHCACTFCQCYPLDIHRAVGSQSTPLAVRIAGPLRASDQKTLRNTYMAKHCCSGHRSLEAGCRASLSQASGQKS